MHCAPFNLCSVLNFTLLGWSVECDAYHLPLEKLRHKAWKSPPGLLPVQEGEDRLMVRALSSYHLFPQVG